MEFLHKFWDIMQYFYVPDDTASLKVDMENGISRRVGNGSSRPPSLPMIGLAQDAHPAGQRIYKLTLEGFKKDVPGNMRVKSPHHFQIISYLYFEWLDDMAVSAETDYRLPAERPGPWEYRDEEVKTIIQKTKDGHLIYYSGHWEKPEMARRHIWGQEPEDVKDKGMSNEE